MTTWTAEIRFQVATRLTRIDRMIESARRTFALNMRFSAAGACGAGVLAKREALERMPPIPVDGGEPLPILDLYDLIELMEWELQFVRAHGMGINQPEVRPIDELRGRLQEIRRKLAGLVERDWIDDSGIPLSDALDKLDEVLGRLGALDRTDVERANSILDDMKRFLSAVSEEVDLTVIFDDISHIDSMLEAAARRLLRPSDPRRDRLIGNFLDGAEEAKLHLLEYLLGEPPAVSPGDPGGTDIPPIPGDHAGRPPRPGAQAVAAGRPGAAPEIAEGDASVVDWPAQAVAAPPGALGPLYATARGGEGDLQADTRKQRQRRKEEDDPRDEEPPSIYGEEIETEPCNGDFVRWAERRCDPAPEPGGLRYTCHGEIVGYIWPGSRWRGAVATAVDEINRTFAWYARYCIHLKLRQLTIAPATERRMERLYARWYNRLTAEIPESRFGTATIHRHHINPFREMMDALQRAALRQGAKLLVVFIDEYITNDRPSLVSANTREYQQIGINWVDSRSPYILAHELIHGLGKSAPGAPGPVTWGHTTGCRLAMSVIARNPRSPINLSGRYLDIAEYAEILRNLGGGVLTRRQI
jgi:hypothetical protein